MNISDKQAIEKLFAGREEGLPLFNIVLEYIGSLGEVKLEAIKTQVSFVAERKFASVLLPQMWLKSQLRALLPLSYRLSPRGRCRIQAGRGTIVWMLDASGRHKEQRRFRRYRQRLAERGVHAGRRSLIFFSLTAKLL
jgi:hypothetical protein